MPLPKAERVSLHETGIHVREGGAVKISGRAAPDPPPPIIECTPKRMTPSPNFTYRPQPLPCLAISHRIRRDPLVAAAQPCDPLPYQLPPHPARERVTSEAGRRGVRMMMSNDRPRPHSPAPCRNHAHNHCTLHHNPRKPYPLPIIVPTLAPPTPSPTPNPHSPHPTPSHPPPAPPVTSPWPLHRGVLQPSPRNLAPRSPLPIFPLSQLALRAATARPRRCCPCPPPRAPVLPPHRPPPWPPLWPRWPP